MDEVRNKKNDIRSTVLFLNILKIFLLIVTLYSIYETLILIIQVPEELRQFSSWYIRKSRLIRLQNEFWFKYFIYFVTVVQLIEFIAILMEFPTLNLLFCFMEIFVTLYRFERSRYQYQYFIAGLWIFINLIFFFYNILLRKLYYHKKLDRYAYRIPTPEISSYNVLGEEKIGVITKSY